MNPRSLEKSLPGPRESRPAVLNDYKRKMNSPVDGFAYLNLIPMRGASVQGVLISITSDDLERLTKRERGYSRIDIAAHMSEPVDSPVYIFISPDIECSLKVPRSYILTCTNGMSDEGRTRWIEETIMGDIEEDLENPVYENFA